MSTPASPFVDPAEPILRGEPTITDEQRADLWDSFHSKSPDELLAHLHAVDAPPQFKQQLYDAKKKMAAPVEPVDKAAMALAKLKELDPSVLEMAETHPKVASLLVNAAAKGPTEGAGASKPAGRGQKTAEGDNEPAPLIQPPRPDGTEHLPPIPEGHYRIRSSDSHFHDIPADQIENARNIDPNLQVVNP